MHNIYSILFFIDAIICGDPFSIMSCKSISDESLLSTLYLSSVLEVFVPAQSDTPRLVTTDRQTFEPFQVFSYSTGLTLASIAL